MLKTVKVTDRDIIVHKNNDDNEKIKGAEWFPTKYANIALFAKKNTGKTTVIENILKVRAGKNTAFVFFASTINKDPTWRRIVKYWQDRNHDVFVHDDIYEGKTNLIREFIDEQKEKEEERKFKPPSPPLPKEKCQLIPLMGSTGLTNIEEERERKRKMQHENQEQEKRQKKAKKPRIIYPEYIIAIDDMGEGMRDPEINQLLKTNRHFQVDIILSGQNLHDLQPQAILQLNYTLIFGGIPEEKRERLYKNMLINVPFDLFNRMYDDATSKPHRFFYIGTVPGGRPEEFRRGFTEKYQI
jgi:hypothetical protein